LNPKKTAWINKLSFTRPDAMPVLYRSASDATVCTVYAHDNRAAIDQRMVEGKPLRRIAADSGLSETSLRRHRDDHLKKSLAKAAEQRREREIAAAERRPIARAETLLDRFEALIQRASSTVDSALAAKKARGGRIRAANDRRHPTDQPRRPQNAPRSVWLRGYTRQTERPLTLNNFNLFF
jgi:hypothetical protein